MTAVQVLLRPVPFITQVFLGNWVWQKHIMHLSRTDSEEELQLRQTVSSWVAEMLLSQHFSEQRNSDLQQLPLYVWDAWWCVYAQKIHVLSASQLRMRSSERDLQVSLSMSWISCSLSQDSFVRSWVSSDLESLPIWSEEQTALRWEAFPRQDARTLQILAEFLTANMQESRRITLILRMYMTSDLLILWIQRFLFLSMKKERMPLRQSLLRQMKMRKERQLNPRE